ncbi:MAG: hypothetical protein EA361_19710 [Bacteroidetes bacterium]|nr:MAG: hypothetical protein EA361_19710 [Bacteroidota bacterium]
MSTNYNILLKKLDAYIRKFYLHKLIKGGFLFITGFLSLFFLVVVLEYFGYFNTATRGFLYYGFIAFNLFVFVYYVVKPVLGLVKIGKRVSLEDAAVLLGKHFKNEVNDKILNTLQLQKNAGLSDPTNELLLAGIEQKSSKLVVYPFQNAINLKENLRYIPVSLFLIVLFITGWIVFPFLLKEPAARIIQYNQHFERPAPFSIAFVNDLPLEGIKNERFVLQVTTEGSVIPENLEIQVNGIPHRMSVTRKNEFQYEFRSLVEPVSFYLRSGNFRFGPYSLDIISKAVIKNFNLIATFPEYTRLGKESFLNLGDIQVPEGTDLMWQVYTEDTDNILFLDNEESTPFEVERTNVFGFGLKAVKDFQYSIVALNEDNVRGDSLRYNVRVVPDAFPSVTIEEYQDSILISRLFFRGLIMDDYGFTGLNFKYRVIDEKRKKENDAVRFSAESISFDPLNLNQSFYYAIDLNNFGIQPGKTFEYFFEVTDNDRVNGPKSAQSRIYSFSLPTYDEMIAQSLASDEEVKSGLSENIEDVNTIQDDIDKLRRSMLESESISWEQQEALKNLLDKQKQAQENYEQLKQMNKDKNVRDQQFKQQDENILKKQEQLQKLFDEVLTDELKDLYQQIQEELEKLNRESVFEMLEKMQFEMEDFERRLDRALELFKQLQVERMLSESVEALERIKEELDQLNESMEADGITDDTTREQSDINEQFDNLKDLLEEMSKKNEDLVRPNSLDDTSELQDNISKDLMDALQEMMKSEPGKAGSKQQDASGKMDQLGQQLQSMLSSMQQENLAEDIRTIREILDNLIKTSFAQENLMEEVRAVNIRDPKYVFLIQEQRKISNDLVMIKDSLEALARRQIQIESYITREIAEINMNIEVAIDQLINRRKQNGLTRQQFVMTHINNLALLLNESMENMQNQMQADGEGGGDPKQGEGAEGFQDLRQMQEQMNQMLEQMREGHQPMPGESGEGGMGLSEQLARMAAEQEAIRNRLNELAGELRKEGQNISELDQLMREMERTEMDIVTNNITRQTQLRQERILSRLLEHERAELEREQEERRVGETAKFYDLSNPEDFFEYNREKNRAMDMLRSMPPGFRPHYKSLVELYFLNVQE